MCSTSAGRRYINTLKFFDGTMLSIDTIAVEDEVAANMYERAEHANTEVQIRLLLELVDEMRYLDKSPSAAELETFMPWSPGIRKLLEKEYS